MNLYAALYIDDIEDIDEDEWTTSISLAQQIKPATGNN
jgi:hypothetical protein